MKKIRTAVLLVLLAVLVVPFSGGRLKEGGTLEVRALAWRFVRWHALIGEDDVFTATRLYPFPLSLQSYDALLARELAKRGGAPADPTGDPTDADGGTGLREKTVAVSDRHSSIRLTLPADWVCEELAPTKDEPGCGVRFGPADGGGRVRLRYETFFGVCGTGLEERELAVRDGIAAVGTYDGADAWDFVYFRDAPGVYAAWNEGLSGGALQTATEILQDAVLGEGELPRTEAEAAGAKALGADSARVRGDFDLETGNWTVTTYDKRPDFASSVTIAPDGKAAPDDPADGKARG